MPETVSESRLGTALGKELTMWDDESDTFEAMDEDDSESESGEDISDLELAPDLAEDEEEEALDEDNPYADDQD